MKKTIWIVGKHNNDRYDFYPIDLSEENFRTIIKNCSKNRWCHVMGRNEDISFSEGKVLFDDGTDEGKYEDITERDMDIAMKLFRKAENRELNLWLI